MDAAMECSGAAAAASVAINGLAPGGTFVAVGTGADSLSVPMPPPFMNRELLLLGDYDR